MLLWLCLLVGVTANQVANDFCAGAITLTAGAGSGTIVGATEDNQVYQFYGSDVFYKYVATTTGWATFNYHSTSSEYLSAVVFYGSSCAKPGPSSSYANYSSWDTDGEITWPIFNGSTYYLAVGGYYSTGHQTAFTWTLSTATDNTPTSGDSCQWPIAVPASGALTVSIDGATKQDYQFDGSADIFVWYTANCSGVATVTTLSYTFQTAVSSYYSQSCDDTIGIQNYKQQDYGNNATITFPVWNGAGYLIAVGPEYTGNSGTIDLQFTCVTQAAPANDVPATATPVTGSTFSTSTTGANTDFNSELCYYSAPTHEVWIAYNATCTGKLQLSINYTYVAILRGTSVSNAQVIYCSSGYNHTVDVSNGDNLWYAIDGSGDNIVGTFTCTPSNNIPPNTYCAGAIPITSAVQTISFVGAITDPGSNRAIELQDNSYCYSNYYVEFFTYNATCTGDATITVNSSTGESLGYLVYQDSTCAAWYEPALCEEGFTSSGYGTFSLKVNAYDKFYIGISYYYSSAVVGNVDISAACNGVGVTSAPTPGTTYTPTIGSTYAPTNGGSSAPTTPTTSSAPTTSKAPTSSSVAPTLVGTTYAPTAPTGGTTAPSVVAAAGAVEFGVASFLGCLLL